MFYDYYGFPAETYTVQYPAPEKTSCASDGSTVMTSPF